MPRRKWRRPVMVVTVAEAALKDATALLTRPSRLRMFQPTR